MIAQGYFFVTCFSKFFLWKFTVPFCFAMFHADMFHPEPLNMNYAEIP